MASLFVRLQARAQDEPTLAAHSDFTDTRVGKCGQHGPVLDLQNGCGFVRVTEFTQREIKKGFIRLDHGSGICFDAC